MARITFESATSRFSILNPFNNFAVEQHEVEVRKDPLLGDTSVYNPFLKDKAKFFFSPNDLGLFRRLAEDSAPSCVFCPGSVRDRTARYPDEVTPGGRIEQGEAVLFANAFSVGAHHSVIVLSRAHALMPSEMQPELFLNGFLAARRMLRRLHPADSSASFTTISANYLQPAGASLVHPHMQMLVTPVPYSLQARLLDASRLYLQRHGTAYFDDLVEAEQRSGSRYVGRLGSWHWIAAFSPIGANEIIAIHADEQDAAALPDADLLALSGGIAKVLWFYEGMGFLSFNFSLFSVRREIPADGFRCLFRIITRQNLYPNYRNDDYFLQKLLQTELIFTLPEELAEGLRKVFSREGGAP